MALKVKTAATVPALTVANVRSALRVPHSLDDAYLEALIAVATDSVEILTQTCLTEKTYIKTWDCFPAHRILKLERPPVSSITSLKYVDEAGTQQTFSASNYTTDLISHPARICLKEGLSWPAILSTVNAVEVEYVAGYTNPDSIPAPLLQAVRFLVGHWYQNREPVTDRLKDQIPMTVDFLVLPYRVWR